MSTPQSVSNTRLRVDLTHMRMQSMHRPLWCCISGALPHPPLPPPSVHLHHSMLPFSLFWVFFFFFLVFMYLFFVFLRVYSAICNYLIFVVWGGLWNLFDYVFLLRSFGCTIFDTPSLTTFIGGQFSWYLHQESIGPHHSFDALSLFILCLLLLFQWFMIFLSELPNP